MAWVSYDFECLDCEAVWDDIVKKDDIRSECPACGKDSTNRLLSSPAIQTFSLLSAEDRSAKMRKRSEEHTKKELRKEPERWGAEGVRRAREGQIRSK